MKKRGKPITGWIRKDDRRLKEGNMTGTPQYNSFKLARYMVTDGLIINDLLGLSLTYHL